MARLGTYYIPWILSIYYLQIWHVSVVLLLRRIVVALAAHWDPFPKLARGDVYGGAQYS